MTRSPLSNFSRFVSWIALFHTGIFVVFWLTNSLFYASTNDYLVKMVGLQLDYVSILLLASALLAAWSIWRLVRRQAKSPHKLGFLTTWTFNFTAILYVVFFYGSFQLLFKESPVQLNRLGQLVWYFRIILDAILILGFALLAGRVVGKYMNNHNPAETRRTWLPLVISLAVFGLLWGLAFTFPPGSVVAGELANKPKLIAHRGASMAAPENTLIAMQTAVRPDIYGLETDIHLSSDGQLFLMHDDTFKRTTDINSLFPGLEKERVENFTFSEVLQMNAGRWFVEQDPFGAIKRGLVSTEQAKLYAQQLVPTLTDMLEIVRNSGQVFIFDLKQPPESNPYTTTFFDICFDQIRQAGIDPQIWFLVNDEQLQKLKAEAPKMVAVYGANYHSLRDATALLMQGYQVVNVEYGISRQQIKEYQDAGLWVNIYTIDEPWQFSRLWLSGVDSITSSNALVLADLKWPVFGMTYGWYTGLWSIIGVAGIGLMLTLGNQGHKGVVAPPPLRTAGR